MLEFYAFAVYMPALWLSVYIEQRQKQQAFNVYSEPVRD
jgi:hypothetical protein